MTEVLHAGMAQVPASARDAVLARAAGLSGEPAQVLEVAALTGTRVELRGCSRRPPHGAPPAAVDELLACGLLAADGVAAVPARDRAAGGGAGHPGAPRVAIHGRILAALRARAAG